MTANALKILYLVHDLSDPAVTKRVVMMQDGGAQVGVAGFRRTAGTVSEIAGSPATDLGRTYNGGFVQRIWSVLRETALLPKHRALFSNADIIIARNLEMLALAVRGRRLCEKPPVLVYESLDIHRLLLNRGPAGKTLRALEGRLAKNAAALITSSPAFVSSYFEKMSQVDLPVRLIENRVCASKTITRHPRPAGPPWKIGWFGMIRCAKSLAALAGLAAQSDGKIEVVIRGRPAYDQLPGFDRIVADTPGLTFEGPYRNPEDLEAIYSGIHFTWTIDMYEEGLNSSWLLPNRLYEGCLYGAVPLTIEGIETGNFLRRTGIGVTLAPPLDRSLQTFFSTLMPEHYTGLEQAVAAVPLSTWVYGEQDSRELVAWLGALAGEGQPLQEKAA